MTPTCCGNPACACGPDDVCECRTPTAETVRGGRHISYPARPGTATIAADTCPRCKGDNTKPWSMCDPCTDLDVSINHRIASEPEREKTRKALAHPAHPDVAPCRCSNFADEYGWCIRFRRGDKPCRPEENK